MSKERILVVDDEPNLLVLYAKELQEEGYAVSAASGAAEALRAMEEFRPELVILDIRMPGMDGIEAMGRILSRDRRLPIIVHTAYACYKDNFCAWVASAYVIKSSNLGPLKETVHRLLGESRRGKAVERPALARAAACV